MFKICCLAKMLLHAECKMLSMARKTLAFYASNLEKVFFALK